MSATPPGQTPVPTPPPEVSGQGSSVRRILIDIVHPADVLFFRHPILRLTEAGHEIRILSREKDVAAQLLDDFALPHRQVSQAGHGILGLGFELLRRDAALLAEALRFKPHVLTGFGAVAAAHAGFLLRIPSIAFYDSDQPMLQTRITWPVVTRLVVPEAFDGRIAAGRTLRLAGTKELSFFHPRRFTPDRNAALALGLDPDRPNLLLRLVAMRANHDIGKAGWSPEAVTEITAALAQEGVVHLSAEAGAEIGAEAGSGAVQSGPVTADRRLNKTGPRLRPYRGPAKAIHQLMAQCRLVAGQSATMAAEAAVLGVPALYAGPDRPGYVRALADAGLIRLSAPGDVAGFLAEARAALAEPPEAQRNRRDAWIADKPDWSDAIANAILETAVPAGP
ncbi:MAG: DUF354 domain-containing protein [Pseudomonadota bacterium]